MADKFACMTAIWALLVAPGLCRFGVLQACCVPAPSHDKAAAGADDCCKGKHAPAPEKPKPRDCGSCAHVCDAAVKAPGDDHRIDLAEGLLLANVHEAGAHPAAAVQPYLADDVPIVALSLPFPHSDIPLRI